MDTPKPPTGHDIWHAVKGELATNLYPLPFSTLAPTLYHVYLNPEDYEAIEGIVPRIVAEIANALTREVERLNRDTRRRGNRLWGLLRQDEIAAPIEMPPAWDINIQPDQDGELVRGALGIESKLTLPPPVQYGGTPTTRIVKTVLVDGRRSSAVSEVQERTDAVPSARPEPTALSPAAARSAALPPATLTYSDDDQRPHVFIVRKEWIKIGRGGAGSGAWVDVQVMTSPKVSREHCWIRFDDSGRFVIQDVSTWGTSVNDEPIPGPERAADGAVVKPGAAKELPADARIALADALVIHFHVDRPS